MPTPADANFPPLPEPQAAAPLARTILRSPETYRRVFRDAAWDCSVMEIRDDSGHYRIEESGLEYEMWSLDRFSIDARDPLGAGAEIVFEMRIGRGDWRTRAVTRTKLTATATDFLVDATLDAWEGETPFASRRWALTIPRHYV